jgi:hypothetical protein
MLGNFLVKSVVGAGNVTTLCGRRIYGRNPPNSGRIATVSSELRPGTGKVIVGIT